MALFGAFDLELGFPDVVNRNAECLINFEFQMNESFLAYLMQYLAQFLHTVDNLYFYC